LGEYAPIIAYDFSFPVEAACQTRDGHGKTEKIESNRVIKRCEGSGMR